MDYKNIQERIVEMLKKLALDPTQDVAKLFFCGEEELREHLDKIDLSGVVRIKRKSDESLEIRFVDRLKAIDKLQEVVNKLSVFENEQSLLTAIEESVISESGNESND